MERDLVFCYMKNAPQLERLSPVCATQFVGARHDKYDYEEPHHPQKPVVGFSAQPCIDAPAFGLQKHELRSEIRASDQRASGASYRQDAGQALSAVSHVPPQPAAATEP